MPDDKKGKPPLLEESQGPARRDKHLLMGARRDGGQLTYIDFAEDSIRADAAASALVKTGWAVVEVYTRTAEHRRK